MADPLQLGGSSVESSKRLRINPPLLNTASPWATTLSDLVDLHKNSFTGAITTRTSLLEGFDHNDSIHQHCFFDVGAISLASPRSTSMTDSDSGGVPDGAHENETSSLNSYGYSPIKFETYLDGINHPKETKLVIVSVTGTPTEVSTMYNHLYDLSLAFSHDQPGLIPNLAMEINLSCPNISDKPPPAYDGQRLAEYLYELQHVTQKLMEGEISSNDRVRMENRIKIGIKLPPYTWRGQFDMVVDTLCKVSRPAIDRVATTTTTITSDSVKSEDEMPKESLVDFITTTNTLFPALLLSSPEQHGGTHLPTLPSPALVPGTGGLAGAALHPLSLGNVATFVALLSQHQATRDIFVIGAGGVMDRTGYDRMKQVGAGAVGVATVLGREGIRCFEKITQGQ